MGKAHGLIGQDLEKFNDVNILIIVDSLDKDTSQYEELHSKGVQIIVEDDFSVKFKVYELLKNKKEKAGE